LGLVLDADRCRVVAAGLDGILHEERTADFATPKDYETLLNSAETALRQIMEDSSQTTLGVGISMPGLMDYCHQRGILSPNLPLTNNQSPVRDFTERLGIPCVQLQESHALCLAERHYGSAKGMDDFAMLDINIGVGLGVMSGGRLLTGTRGLAGEIGHITVAPEGRQCGCGNIGCLETEACDSALAWHVSQQLQRRVSIEEVLQLMEAGEWKPSTEVERVCHYLAIGVSAVINLFNPSTLFLHGKMFTLSPTLFENLLLEVERRTLAPSFADCQIVLARGSKRQGAIAGIIEYLMNALLPLSVQDSSLHSVHRLGEAKQIAPSFV
jgi:N-acetylglucosamine repressor